MAIIFVLSGNRTWTRFRCVPHTFTSVVLRKYLYIILFCHCVIASVSATRHKSNSGLLYLLSMLIFGLKHVDNDSYLIYP